MLRTMKNKVTFTVMNEGHMHARSPCIDYINWGNELESYSLYKFVENTYEDTIWPSRLRLVSQTVLGCVTRHTRHASVTHFRPILGNIVEVAFMTSPNLYIISHAKGTYFPLARISTRIPPFNFWDIPADPVTEGSAQWLSLSLLALEGFPVSRGASPYSQAHQLTKTKVKEDDPEVSEVIIKQIIHSIWQDTTLWGDQDTIWLLT